MQLGLYLDGPVLPRTQTTEEPPLRCSLLRIGLFAYPEANNQPSDNNVAPAWGRWLGVTFRCVDELSLVMSGGAWPLARGLLEQLLVAWHTAPEVRRLHLRGIPLDAALLRALVSWCPNIQELTITPRDGASRTAASWRGPMLEQLHRIA